MAEKGRVRRRRIALAPLEVRAPKRDDPGQFPLPLQVVDAKALLEEIRREMRPPESAPGKTFGVLAHEWYATASKRLVEPRNEERHLRHLVALHDLRERELTPRRARAELAQLLAPDGPLGASTVNKVRNTAIRVIREAQIEGEWGALNPFDILDRYKELESTHVPIRLEDARLFLPRLRRDRWREACFNILLGPRPGEQKALLKSDVDLQRELVTFRRSNARNQTKTGKERTVPIPRDLVLILREAIDASRTEFVFPEVDGTRQRADKKLSITLREAYRKAGLVVEWRAACRVKACGYKEQSTKNLDDVCPKCQRKRWRLGYPPRVWWRSLRHAAATLHREAGCDPHVITLALGHAPKGTTEGFYTDVTVAHMRRELNKLRLFR